MISDLPVSVDLPDPLGGQVIAWVERDLGWQVVEPGGLLRPVLALATAPQDGVPWIAVLDGSADDDRAMTLLAAGAEDVIGWPDERDRIALAATRLDVGRARPARGPRLTVAGAAGGVGTSTVALAVGGLLAWSGASVLVAGDDALPVLAGVDDHRATSGAHAPVDGVPNLSVAGRRADASTVPWAGDVVVVDDGTRASPSTTLVVARPDAWLRRAADTGRPVVVIGDQPLRARDVRTLLGETLLVQLPSSIRVARAGAAGRVPTSLPGRWLAQLGDALRRVGRWTP